jgi:predicted RND superfamily exporter protein
LSGTLRSLNEKDSAATELAWTQADVEQGADWASAKVFSLTQDLAEALQKAADHEGREEPPQHELAQRLENITTSLADVFTKARLGEFVDPTKSKESSRLHTCVFQPGELGLDADWAAGLVESVDVGGQGERLGVKAGWQFHTIDEAPYSELMLDACIGGLENYTVVFEDIPAAADEAVSEVPSEPNVPKLEPRPPEVEFDEDHPPEEVLDQVPPHGSFHTPRDRYSRDSESQSQSDRDGAAGAQVGLAAGGDHATGASIELVSSPAGGSLTLSQSAMPTPKNGASAADIARGDANVQRAGLETEVGLDDDCLLAEALAAAVETDDGYLEATLAMATAEARPSPPDDTNPEIGVDTQVPSRSPHAGDDSGGEPDSTEVEISSTLVIVPEVESAPLPAASAHLVVALPNDEAVEDAQRQRPKLPQLLVAYCNVVKHWPVSILALYLVITGVLVAALWRPVEISTDFADFIRADGDALRQFDAFLLALATKKGPNDRRLRRLQGEALGALDALGVTHSTIGASSHNWDVAPVRSLQNDFVVFEKSITIIYKAKGGDIFDGRAMGDIQDLELRLRSLPLWVDICSNHVPDALRYYCDPGNSFASYSWPTAVAVEGSASSDIYTLRFDGRGTEQLPPPAALAYMEQGEHFATNPSRLFPHSYEPPPIGSTGPGPATVRTRYVFAFDMAEAADSGSAQQITAAVIEAKERFERLIIDEVYPLLVEQRVLYNHIDVYYHGDVITGHEVLGTLWNDLLWAVGSVFFVVLYLYVHTRSVLVSICAFTIIFGAIPVAYVMVPMSKTTMVSFLSIFLTAGIGSDVIFVFFDFWVQSAEVQQKSFYIEERLAWMLMHAGMNCLATSLTAAASFLANLASALLPLREFGLFMGLCILNVFVLTILLLPSSLVFYEQLRSRRLRKKTSPDEPAGDFAGVLPDPEEHPSLQGSSDAPVHNVKSPEPRRSRRCLLVLLRRIEARRNLYLALTCACVFAFLLGIILTVEIDRDIPEVFPKGHNGYEVVRLQELFSSSPIIDYEREGAVAPPEEAAVCSPFGEAPSLGDQCGLHRCDAQANGGVSNSSTDVSCWRDTTVRSGLYVGVGNPLWDFGDCSNLRVQLRLAVGSQPSNDEVASVWQTVLTNLSLPQDGLALEINEIPALYYDWWEQGATEMSPLFDAGTKRIVQDAATTTNACIVNTICFVGPLRCANNNWQRLTDPSVAFSTPIQRVLQVAPSAATVPRHKRIDVQVVWGIRATAYTPFVGKLEEQWSFDPSYQSESPWSQRGAVALCKDMPEDLRVLTSTGSYCWVELFRAWLSNNNKKFPSRDFDSDVLSWYSTSTEATESLWFGNGRVVASRISFDVDVPSDYGAENILEYKTRWDKYLNEMNNQASFTASHAWHASRAWVRAEAEVIIVGSTVNTIIISAGSGWLGMVAFTLDPYLAFLVLLIVIGIISGLAFFMTVIMAWKLGPLEVVSLVIFVGYAVTFALHVAHSYSESFSEGWKKLQPSSPESEDSQSEALISRQATIFETTGISVSEEGATLYDVRRARVRDAVLRVGGATLSSAISTLGSGAPLLFCTLQLFTKLGGVVVMVTCLSGFFALVVLPATLLLLGPDPGPWHKRCVTKSRHAWQMLR